MKNGQVTDKWNTYEVDTHRPYGNSWEKKAPTLKATRWRHSPTGAVAMVRKIFGARHILRKLALSTHMANYTCTYNGVQFKSKLLHNGTRPTAARPSRRMCYRPAVFFFSFVSLRFYSHTEKCYILLKNHIISLFYFIYFWKIILYHLFTLYTFEKSYYITFLLYILLKNHIISLVYFIYFWKIILYHLFTLYTFEKSYYITFLLLKNSVSLKLRNLKLRECWGVSV